jgi:hypothetical protein
VVGARKGSDAGASIAMWGVVREQKARIEEEWI